MRRYTRERGSMVSAFAVAVVVITGFAGIGIDYARGVRAQHRLQNIADAATLAAVRGLRVSEAEAHERAHAFLGGLRELGFDVNQVEVVIDGANNEVRTRLTGQLPTILTQVIGIRTIDVSAVATGKREASFLDVHLVLDVSASMGLAATVEEMDRMKALTKPAIDAAIAADPTIWVTGERDGCAFACHYLAGWEGSTTFQQIAVDNDVLLRWDVLLEAAKTLTDTVLGPLDADTVIRVGAFAMSEGAEKLSDPSTDAAAVKASFTTTTLPHRFTLPEIGLPQIATAIGPAGEGYTQDTPKKVVVVATDGVATRLGPNGADRPFDPAWCQPFKDQGIEVAVINIEYINDPLSAATVDRVQPIHADLEPNLKACASSLDLYVSAASADDVRAAFYEVAKKVQARGMLRLTH